MRLTQAIVRRPGREMGEGLTTSRLGPPDYAKALDQFADYVTTLKDCGMAVTELETLEGYPDAHFVEDAAVVLPEVAVITCPGAVSRQGEVATIEAALQPFRQTVRIRPPGTLDGGDVLVIGRRCFIGLSHRTNLAGAAQLGEILSGLGYAWQTVPVAAGLHFKSGVNTVGQGTLLTTRAFADHPALAEYQRIVVTEAEAYAANTLLINGRLIMPAGFPDTRQKLSTLGASIIELDTSEFRKMDGGLTCLSLRF